MGPVWRADRRAIIEHPRPFENDFVPLGLPSWRDLSSAINEISHGRVLFLALHGGSGEDGTVQRWLEDKRVSFTGSSAAASVLAFDKVKAKEVVRNAGALTTESATVSARDLKSAEKLMGELLEVHERLVLKPVADGSSSGLMFVGSDSRADAIARLSDAPDVVFILERFVRGRELTVGVLERPTGDTIALPCSEVFVEMGRSFDFEGKYLGRGTKEITPAELTPDVAQAAQSLALTVHRAMGCSGYSRTDMIVDESGPVFLEINTLPGLTSASFIPQQLKVAGISMHAFVDEQIELASRRG
jgi:D-alanine-D-alanine ligase